MQGRGDGEGEALWKGVTAVCSHFALGKGRCMPCWGRIAARARLPRCGYLPTPAGAASAPRMCSAGGTAAIGESLRREGALLREPPPPGRSFTGRTDAPGGAPPGEPSHLGGAPAPSPPPSTSLVSLAVPTDHGSMASASVAPHFYE